jgi:hypothetical protein
MQNIERNDQSFGKVQPSASRGRHGARDRPAPRRAANTRNATQNASRFAKRPELQITNKRKSDMRTKFTAAVFAGLAFSGMAGAAQAQSTTTLTNGSYLTVSSGPLSGSGITSVDLGSAGVTGIVSQMPMSLSYGSVNLNISFQGGSSLYQNAASTWSPVQTNFLRASEGTVTLDFSQAQRYLSMAWGSQDSSNTISFYNQGQLVTSTTGAAVRPISTAVTGSIGSYTTFSFSELTFDRVVIGGTTLSMEVGDISFSDSPQIAPIPLNAASFGGMLAFFGMMGARGGGWRVQMRAFASSLRGRQQRLRLA